MASSKRGLPIRGSFSHLKCPRPRCSGMRRSSSPRVFKYFRRASDNVSMNLCTSAGGAGHPLTGMVAGQWKRCSRVPTALWHNWQDESSIFQRGTAALRACGHCPPTTAEALGGKANAENHAKAHQSNRMGAPGSPAHSGTAATSKQAPVQ